MKNMEEQTLEVNILTLEIVNKDLCFCLLGRIVFFIDSMK